MEKKVPAALFIFAHTHTPEKISITGPCLVFRLSSIKSQSSLICHSIIPRMEIVSLLYEHICSYTSNVHRHLNLLLRFNELKLFLNLSIDVF